MRIQRAPALLAGVACVLLTAGTLTTGPALAAPAARQDNPTPNISLTLPTFIVTFGQEGAADLIISVPPAPGGPNPTGQVAVLAGGIGAICQGTIPSGATVLDCHMPSAFLHPGQYSVWAAYGGDAHYKITDSSHNPQQLIVNRESTSTTLTVPTAPIASDDEGGTTLTFQVSAATNGPPTGSVTVTTGSTTICSGLLANGTGACAIPTGTLGPGTYPVTATYNGEDPDFATSADVKNLTIAKADTSTTLTLSAPTVTVGDEQTENFSVAVTSDAGTPSGSVDISTGSTPICSAPLVAGVGSCAPTVTLRPGTYPLTATYGGDPTFAGSASDAQALTIKKATASTAVTLSAARATFGHEQAERLSVQVTAPGGSPSGTVAIKAGSTSLCVVSLVGGKGSCTLGATKLRPGTYHLAATYSGDASHAGATSGSKALTVASEPTTTALTLSTAKVKVGHEQSEHLTVTVKPGFSGTPAGKVTVKAGKTAICTINLAKGKGTCTLTASKLRAGKYALTASYAGAAPYAGSVSAKKTLTVTK